MLQIAAFLFTVLILSTSEAEACKRMIDEEAYKKDLTKNVIEALGATEFVLRPSEVTKTSVEKFSVDIDGTTINRAFHCGDVEIASGLVSVEWKDKKANCFSKIWVKRRTVFLAAGSRVEFSYSNENSTYDCRRKQIKFP